MKPRTMCWILLWLAMATTGGCSYVDIEWGASDEARKRHEERQRAQKQSDKAFNDLWLQGYGFGNDNAEQRRKGLPLKNFDGSIRSSESK